MKLSHEIRAYTLGLLYLIMGAFIMGAVTYLAGLIPDYKLSPTSAKIQTSTQYQPAILVAVKTAPDENRALIGSSYIYYKNINLTTPQPGRAWLIVLPTPSTNITPYVSGYLAKHTNAEDGNTYILWQDKITEISIYLSTQTPPKIPLKIYSVDANIPIPPPSDYLNPPPQQDTKPTTEISSRTIINFIGWVAGIIIAVIGLSKFNISI